MRRTFAMPLPFLSTFGNLFLSNTEEAPDTPLASILSPFFIANSERMTSKLDSHVGFSILAEFAAFVLCVVFASTSCCTQLDCLDLRFY